MKENSKSVDIQAEWGPLEFRIDSFWKRERASIKTIAYSSSDSTLNAVEYCQNTAIQLKSLTNFSRVLGSIEIRVQNSEIVLEAALPIRIKSPSTRVQISAYDTPATAMRIANLSKWRNI